jgi:hypothetical protein
MKRAVIVLVLLTILGAGCGSSASSDALVRDAILHYLAGRTNLNMGKMNVKVDSLKVEGDTASAQVTISSRDDAKASMEMTYQLRRAGGGWEVVPPAGSAGDAHGGMSPPADPQAGGELPPGHPPAGGAPEGAAEGSELPQGHPPIGSQPQQTQPKGQDLPAGHPPVGAH